MDHHALCLRRNRLSSIDSRPSPRSNGSFCSGRARGDASPRADIDLAIACPGIDPRRRSDIVEAAENAPTLVQIDLIRMETAPAALLSEINREGQVLYERHDRKAPA